MFLSKLFDAILDNLTPGKVVLTTFLTFIKSTLVVYYFQITSEAATLLITSLCALTSAAIVFRIEKEDEITVEKKPPTPKRRKK